MRLILCGILFMALAGCSDAPGGGDETGTGDCTVRIRYAGTVYRADNQLAADAPRDEALGTGQPVDCDAAPVSGYGTVEVSAISGVDPAVAVAVDGGVDGDLSGLYIAEDADVSDLPSALVGG